MTSMGSADRPPAVELIEVAKSFGDTEVIRPMDLAVGPGEFVVLLGPSGCGKSTVLKMIAGLEDVSDGEIYVDGRLVNYVRPRDRNVAMVFQNYALYPHMTVRENIAFPLAQGRTPRPGRGERATLVEEAASIVALRPFLDRKPAQLSGGQRQRVALARAIVRRPAVFLMDEPLSNLDAILRAEMRISLLDVHRRVGRATVYVTHDQTEAMTMADRVVVLHEGAVQQVGTPEEIYTEPANSFVARFVGTPRMALQTGTVTDSGEVALGDVTFRPDGPVALAAGEWVGVGIRPSGAHVTDRPRGPYLRGRVTRRDYLGGDCFVEVDVSTEHAVVVRTEPEDTVSVGDLVKVEIRPGAAHLFGPSGERAGGLSLLGPP